MPPSHFEALRTRLEKDVDLQALFQLEPKEFASRVVQLADASGTPLTTEVVEAALQATRLSLGELKDDSLDSVAGGFGNRMPVDTDIITSAFVNSLWDAVARLSYTSAQIPQTMK